MTGPHWLRVSHHGGRCCGVKHIHEFPTNPSRQLSAYTGSEKLGSNGYVQMINPGKLFLYLKAPAQTALERFDKVLADVKAKQPKGLVEIVLGKNQSRMWSKSLEERGFKKGPEFRNSNTASTLQVWYLVNE